MDGHYFGVSSSHRPFYCLPVELSLPDGLEIRTNGAYTLNCLRLDSLHTLPDQASMGG
jgi:hypothetical protein